MQAGDIGLCYGTHALDRLIQVGEWLERLRHLKGHRPAYRWVHSFVVTSPEGDTVEAVGRGVVESNVSAHGIIGVDYKIVPCPAGVDRQKVLEFVTFRIGASYNYLDFGLLGVDILFHTKFHTGGKNTYICSELCAAGLEAGGWKSPKVPALMMPSDLAFALEVSPI